MAAAAAKPGGGGGFIGSDPTSRINPRSAVHYGHEIFLGAGTLPGGPRFLSTLPNPVYGSPRLCASTREEISRPFRLVAAFEVCPVNSVTTGQVEEYGNREELTFGAKVRLRHCGTGMWLTVDPNRTAKSDGTCCMVYLDPLTTAGGNGQLQSVFIVAAALKSRGEGDVVVGQNLLHLHTEQGDYIRASSYTTAEGETAVEICAGKYLKAGGTAAGGDKTTSFQAGIFDTPIPSGPGNSERSLAIGDVVRLGHAEFGGFLTATGVKNEKAVVVQRDSGKRNSNRLFVIVGPNEARSEVGGAIEAKVTEKGNANIGDAFRLLHLATLQYLAFGEPEREERGRLSKERPLVLCDPTDTEMMARSYFRFTLVFGDMVTGRVSPSSYGNLESATKLIPTASLFVTSMFVRTNLTEAGLAADVISQDEVDALSDQGIDPGSMFDRQIVRARESGSSSRDANAFRFERLPMDFVNDVLFALAVQHHLNRFCHIAERKGLQFLENPAHSEHEGHFERVDVLLQRLCGYTKVQTLEESSDLRPNQPMQQLFVFQGVTQTVIHVLKAITNALGEGQLSRLAKDKAIELTFGLAKMGWKFVAGAVKDYSFAGNYISSLCLDLMILHWEYGLGVTDVLIECYRNNPETGNAINADRAFASKLMQFGFKALSRVGRAEQFVEFLTTLCTCGEGEDQLTFKNSVLYLAEQLINLPFMMPTRTSENISVVPIADLSLAELKDEAKRLEVPTPEGHKGKPETWIQAIRAHSGDGDDCSVEIYTNEVQVDVSEHKQGDAPAADGVSKLKQRFAPGTPEGAKWAPLAELPYAKFELRPHLQKLAAGETTVSRPVASAQYHATCVMLISKLPIKGSAGRKHNDSLRQLPISRIDCVLACMVDSTICSLLRSSYCSLLNSLYIPSVDNQSLVSRWCYPAPASQPKFTIDPELILDSILVALRQAAPLKSNTASATGDDVSLQVNLLRCLDKLLSIHPLEKERLLLVEQTTFDLLVHLHKTFLPANGHELPESVKMLFTEFLILLDTLQELSVTEVVQHFADEYAEIHKQKLKAEAVVTDIQLAWVSEADPLLRAMLLDVLVIDDTGISARAMVLLEKMHSQQTRLLASVSEMVFTDGDQHLVALVQETVALCSRLKTSMMSGCRLNHLHDVGNPTQREKQIQQEVVTRLRDIQVEATANETFETGVFEKIAYHAGLPQLAASLLQCSRTASAEYLKIVFALLQYICDGNQVVPQNNRTNGPAQAILKNNASVVKSMSDDIITSLAELGSKNRLKNGCRYLDALYLCVMCEGFPIATNQDRVLRAINASKATDEKFWSKTDVSAGNEKKIPCIDMFSKNAADLADKTSRITYHVKLIHLLAACCENSNESTARKIRILVPLTFAAAVILHADTPTKIRTAYYRIVDSLYVEPVAVQPSLAFDIYARFVGTNPAGDVHEAHLKSLGSLLQKSVSIISDEAEDIRAVLAVYQPAQENDRPTECDPSSLPLSCGPVRFVRSVFQSGIFEALEETFDGSPQASKVHQAHYLSSSPELFVDAIIRLIGYRNIPTVSRQALSDVVAALNYSHFFDPKRALIFTGSSLLTTVSALRKDLSENSEGLKREHIINSFARMVQCAEMTWGESDDKPEWASKTEDGTPVCTENNWWRMEPHLLSDRFLLRKFMAQLFYSTCKTDTTPGSPRAETADAEEAPVTKHRVLSMFHCQKLVYREPGAFLQAEELQFTGLCQPEKQAVEWQFQICRNVLESLTADADIQINAGLVFAALNGALLMSHKIRELRESEDGSSCDGASSEAGSESSMMSDVLSEAGPPVDPNDDDGNDDEIEPEEDVQIQLAKLGTDQLIQAFMRPDAPEKVTFRAIRLGVLLLAGGNVDVQDAFRTLVENDKQKNLKATFFNSIRKNLRNCILSPEPQTAQRYIFAARLLRFVQLLCEGHNEWFQLELLTQIKVTTQYDMVQEIGYLFGEYIPAVVARTPPIGKLKPLPDSHPILQCVVASLQLVGQFAETLIELCQGPRVLIQRRLNLSVAVVPPALDWFMMRQHTLESDTTQGVSRRRLKNRKKRLQLFRSCEGSIIKFLNALCEGSDEMVVASTLETLRDCKLSHDTDGVTVMVRNMNQHGLKELRGRQNLKTDIQKPSGEVQTHLGGYLRSFLSRDEVELGQDASWAPDGDENTIEIINEYYILLQTLKVEDKFEVPQLPSAGGEGGDEKDLTHEFLIGKIQGAVKQVEIIREERPELVYFSVPPSCIEQLNDRFVCNWLTETMHGLDRDNENARVTDLLAKMDEYITVHDHQEWLKKTHIPVPGYNQFRVSHLAKIGMELDMAGLAVAFLINVVLMLSSGSVEELQIESPRARLALALLSPIHVLLALLKFTTYMMHTPLMCMRDEMEGEEEGTKDEDAKAYGSFVASLGYRLTSVLSHDDVNTTIFIVLYVLFSVAGMLFDHFFFAYHLLELFFKIRLLQLAFNAVALHGKSLCATLLMGLVLTYIYAAIGWRIFLADFKYGFHGLPEWSPAEEEAATEAVEETGTGAVVDAAKALEACLAAGKESEQCASPLAGAAADVADVAEAVAEAAAAPVVTFLDWVLIHWEVGLAEGPESMEDWSSSSKPWSYVLLSLSYFMFIVVILGAVISGIIIDAFGEMRDDKAEREEDLKNVDFVSGINRGEFDQVGIDFDKYRSNFHNPVHYLYYKLYLVRKHKTEYTGQESYISEMIEGSDASFLPAGRSGALEQARGQQAERDQAPPQWAQALMASTSEIGRVVVRTERSITLSREAEIDPSTSIGQAGLVEGSTEAEIEALWHCYDEDDSGFLEIDELLVLSVDMVNLCVRRLDYFLKQTLSTGTKDYAVEFFMRLTTGLNDSIQSIQEAMAKAILAARDGNRAALQSLSKFENVQTVVTELMDSNRDGKISRDEFFEKAPELLRQVSNTMLVVILNGFTAHYGVTIDGKKGIRASDLQD